MDNLIISLEVVLPLFPMLVIGYLIRHFKVVTPDGFDQMNVLTFRLFLPLVIFRNIYESDLSTAFNGKLILTGIVMVLCMFALAFVVVLKLEKENRRRGVLIQGILRSNFIIFGLSVATNMYGEEACGAVSLLITFIIPIYNALAVVALESFRGEGRVRPLVLVKGIVTNPLILAAALGMLVLLSGIRFPSVLESTVSDLASVATPLALVVLGGSFEIGRVKGNLRPLAIGIVGRLLAMPALFLPFGVLLGFRGPELLGLMVMLGAPTSVSSYTMAQQMGGDSELAGELVVFGTMLSVITIFLWTFLLKSLGYL